MTLLCVLCASAVSLQATTVQGSVVDAAGSPLSSGKIILRLSQEGTVTDPALLLIQPPVVCTITTGAIDTGCTVRGNDTISPAGTFYKVRIITASGHRLLPERNHSIEGATWDIGTATPLASETVAAEAYQIIQDEGTGLTQRQNLNFTGPGVACSDDATNARTNCSITGGGGGGSTHQIDGLNLAAQDPINFQDTTEIDWTNPSLGNIQTAIITGSIADSKLASNYSGIGSCAASNFVTALNDNAAPTCAQPAFGNLSGSATDAQVPDNLTLATLDTTFELEDNLDPTKRLQLQLSGLTTATTRTWTVPDVSGEISLLGQSIQDAEVDDTITLSNLTQITARNYADLQNRSHGAVDHTGDVLPDANQALGAFYFDLDNLATPANPLAGTRRLFVDSATGQLSVRTSAGTTVSLEQGGGSGGYDTVQDEGTALTQRSILNFTGTGVTCTDDAGNTRTNCDIPGGAGATHQIDGVNLAAQDPINFQDTAEIDFTNPSLGNIQAAIVTGSIADFKLASNYSGIGSCPASNFVTALNDNAAPTCTQPAFSDLSGSATDAQIPDNLTLATLDTTFEVQDNLDNTKRLQLQLSGITALTTRTWTVPDASGEVSLLGQTIEDAELASNYSGIGSCTNQFPRTLNDNAAPTCADVAPADFASQTANTVLAAPDGAAGEPTFRLLADADVPAAISRDTETPAAGDISGSLSAGYTIDALAVASAELAVANKTFKCNFVLFDSTGLLDGDDIPSISNCSRPGRAITVTEVHCETDAGSPSINLQRDDGTPADILTANLTCTTGGANGTIAAAEDNFAATDKLNFVMVSASTANRISVLVEYTVDN